jgi:hypothetical protein
MPDLKLAAQDAIFDKLNGTGAITAIGPVWQHPPDGLEPPYTLIGAMNATPFGGKDGGLDNIEVEILTVVRQPGREHLTPLMTAVRDALEGAALTATGVALSPPVFESDDDDLLDDGQTYVGTQRFSLFAQPA